VNAAISHGRPISATGNGDGGGMMTGCKPDGRRSRQGKRERAEDAPKQKIETLQAAAKALPPTAIGPDVLRRRRAGKHGQER
jgi:hypothetical protein